MSAGSMPTDRQRVAAMQLAFAQILLWVASQPYYVWFRESPRSCAEISYDRRVPGQSSRTRFSATLKVACSTPMISPSASTSSGALYEYPAAGRHLILAASSYCGYGNPGTLAGRPFRLVITA